MNEVITNLLNRLSKYDFFTTFMPGLFLWILMRKIGLIYSVAFWGEEFGWIFFLGIISSRVGSMVVEPIAKMLMRFAPYEDFIDWSKNEQTVADRLIRNLNWHRSLCGMVLCLAGMLILKYIPGLSPVCKFWAAIVLLFLIFADSYRRQVSFIVRRIEKFRKDINIPEAQK